MFVASAVLAAASMSAQSVATATCTFHTFNDNPRGFVGLDPQGINKFGTIVGTAETSSTFEEGFIRFTNGTVQAVVVPNSLATFLTKRNASGVNVGRYQSKDGKIHGFVLFNQKRTDVNYPNVSITNLLGINAGGTMVGAATGSSGEFGFRLSNGKFSTIRFPHAVGTSAVSISDNGFIVGSYIGNSAGGFPHGFALINGTFKKVDHPQGVNSTQLTDVNTAGTIVGFYSAGEFSQGFILRNGTFKNVKYPNAIETTVNAINNLGVITGRIHLPNDVFAGYTATCK